MRKKAKIDREILIQFLNLGMPKTKIAQYFNINAITIRRYLKNFPISEEEKKSDTFPDINIRKKSMPKINKTPNESQLPDNWADMSLKDRKEFMQRRTQFVKKELLK